MEWLAKLSEINQGGKKGRFKQKSVQTNPYGRNVHKQRTKRKCACCKLLWCRVTCWSKPLLKLLKKNLYKIFVMNSEIQFDGENSE